MAEFSTKITNADPWGRMPGGEYYNDWGHPSGQIDWSQVGQTIVNPEDWYGPGKDRAGGPFVMTEPLGTTTTPTASDFDNAVQNVAYPGTSYQASGLGYVPYQSESTDTSIYPNSTTGTGTANYNYGTANNNYSGGNMANYTNPTTTTGTEANTEPPFNIPNSLTQFPFSQQYGQNQQYVDQLTNYLQSQEQMPDMYSRISGQLNLPTQREAMLGMGEMSEQLYSQISGMPENVALTSRESTVTAPQQQRIIESRQAPLMKGYTELGKQMGTAGARLTASEQEASRRMEMEVAKQQMNLLPWEKSYDLMTIMQAREYTGWTFANSQELNRLIANQGTGYAWTTDEADRANKLALAEWQYKTALDSIKESGAQDRETARYQQFDLGGGLNDLWSNFF